MTSGSIRQSVRYRSPSCLILSLLPEVIPHPVVLCSRHFSRSAQNIPRYARVGAFAPFVRAPRPTLARVPRAVSAPAPRARCRCRGPGPAHSAQAGTVPHGIPPALSLGQCARFALRATRSPRSPFLVIRSAANSLVGRPCSTPPRSVPCAGRRDPPAMSPSGQGHGSSTLGGIGGRCPPIFARPRGFFARVRSPAAL